MITSEVLAIAYGLASAASWGAGDFSGGLATKRHNVYSVILVAHVVSGLLLVPLAFFVGEPIPSWYDLVLGALGGVFGVFGLMALYSGLASGRMGIVAPVAGVVAAAFPVGVSLFLEGLPSIFQLMGFAVGLVAVGLLSGAAGNGTIAWRELGLPVAAGLGFALFYIIMDQVSQNAVLWPLVAVRVASVTFLFLCVTIGRRWDRPATNQLPIITLAGLFDTAGNGFFILAAQAGRLDIAALVSSLYPAVTVLLAWLILKERLMPQQWVGVIAAMVALVLIAS
ncbi:MAG: EamA family transporter [Ardenticatenaceae bacterium]